MKKLLLIASLGAFAVAGNAMAAGDSAAGQAKSAVCAGCHGADGNSMNPVWPKLAGQHADYIAKQLSDFKDGARKDATMSAMAAALSADDMANLGAYYGSQKTKLGTTAEDMAELGQTIYRAGNAASGVPACAACHGPSGAGNQQAKFPGLSGQHADYVVKTLKDFRSGARANDAGSMMRGIAAKMTDAEMTAVAQYMQGLR